MGCTPFKEHWDRSADDLLIDAAHETPRRPPGSPRPTSTRTGRHRPVGMSGVTLAQPLKLQGKPVTRVENYCATGSEACARPLRRRLRRVRHRDAAIGVEKVKDSGYQGLTPSPSRNDGTSRTLTAAAMFSLVAPAYAKRYGMDPRRCADVGPHRVEEPRNGAKQPAGAVPARDVGRRDLQEPRSAGSVGVRLRRRRRRLGRSDRGACRGRAPLHRQAALREGPVVRGRQRLGLLDPSTTTRRSPSARRRPRRVRPGGHHRSAPRARHGRGARLLHAHRARPVEDLGFSAARPRRGSDVEAGVFDLRRRAAGQPRRRPQDRSATRSAQSGLRMLFECWLQLRGEAPGGPSDRHIDRGLALTHNLGGYPGEMVSFVGIFGNRKG